MVSLSESKQAIKQMDLKMVQHLLGLLMPKESCMPKFNRESGLSLMEVLVVMGLIGALAIISIPTFLEVVNNYRVSTSATEIGVKLRFARNASIKKKKDYTVTIKDQTDTTNPNTYTVTDEFQYNGGVLALRTYTLNSGVKIKAGSPTNITFKPDGQASTGFGSPPITLIDPRGNDAYTITVLKSGAVEVVKL
jgi:Tfp pilus assembly protein FimT